MLQAIIIMPSRGACLLQPRHPGHEIIKLLSLPSAGTGASLIVWKTLPGYSQPGESMTFAVPGALCFFCIKEHQSPCAIPLRRNTPPGRCFPKIPEMEEVKTSSSVTLYKAACVFTGTPSGPLFSGAFCSRIRKAHRERATRPRRDTDGRAGQRLQPRAHGWSPETGTLLPDTDVCAHACVREPPALNALLKSL